LEQAALNTKTTIFGAAARKSACAHDGHAQAWRTHAMNIYAHTKGPGFVGIGYVDVDATGNL